MLITMPFSKYEGAKNDFLLIDNREGTFPRGAMRGFARAACHRRTGVGADGVIFIEGGGRHDFRMLFFNPDGSDGSMCGNGGRCAVLFAAALGIAGDPVAFELLGAEYRGEFAGDSIRLHFPPPTQLALNLNLNLNLKIHFLHTGAPHAVLFLEEIGPPWSASTLEDLAVDALGAEIRRHARFAPGGANVNFLSIGSGGVIALRTFEKGVEAETESCGTGTIASALIAALLKNLSSPVTLRSHGGDILRVGFERKGEEFGGVYLEGPARRVFDGSVRFDAATGALAPEERGG